MRPWTLLYYRPLPQGSLFLTHLLNIPSQKLQVSRRPQGSLVISVLHTSRPSQCRPHTDDGSEDVWAKVFQKPSHSTTATTYPHGSFISTTLRKQRSLSSSWCHMDCLRRFFRRHTPRVMCFCEDATLLQSGSSSLSLQAFPDQSIQSRRELVNTKNMREDGYRVGSSSLLARTHLKTSTAVSDKAEKVW